MRLATLNLSIDACKHHPALVYDAVRHAFDELDVDGLAAQEAGAADAILARLRHDRVCQVYRPTDRTGAPATPVLVRPDVILQRTYSMRLAPRTFVGLPGAGIRPWAKAKFLNVAQWIDPESRRRILLGSMHGESSAHLNPLRRRLSRRIMVRAGEYCDRIDPGVLRGCLFVGSDTNLKPGDPYLRPLYAAGMISAQLTRGPVPTHGHRAIDDLFHRRRDDVVSLHTLEAHDTVSDHDLTVAEYAIVPLGH